MASRLFALARWAASHRYRVIAVWLLVLATVVTLGTTLKGELSNQFKVPGTESQQAADLLNRDFPAANGGTMRVVFAGSVESPAAEKSIATGIRAAGSVPGVA